MTGVGEWVTYYADIDGVLTEMRVDMRAGNELRELGAPNLLRVQYELRAPDGDGLPSGEDEAVIDRLRHELRDWVGALGGRLAGEASGGGQHSWFFYVPCGWLEAANLIHRIGLRNNVALGVEMAADATCRFYHEQLLPSAEELRRAQIATHLTELADMGDVADVPRPVSHEARFDNRVQALAAADWARRQGFVVDGLLPPAGARQDYSLTFHRQMPLHAARLEQDVALVADMTARLGGRYAGWRTQPCLAQSA